MQKTGTIKIFVDAHVFDDEFQGSRTFIREIYQELSKYENIHLYLAAFDTGNLAREFAASSKIEFVRLPSRSSWKRLLVDIPALIKKYEPGYAHFQYIAPPVKSCRYIVTTHDVLFKDYPEEFPLIYRLSKHLLFKRSARKADILTTVSGFSKLKIQQYFGIKKPVHVTPNGVSSRFFMHYEKEHSRNFIRNKYGIDRFILYVSRIEPRKNHHLLLKSWLDLELYRQGIYLVLLGHQSIRVPEFDQLSGSLSSAVTKFIFRGSQVNDDDLLEFYRAADVFAYPSKAEGFGIPPLEAAALKVPVICSNTSAMGDFTFFGDNHVDPNHYNQFRSRLEQILIYPPSSDELAAISAIIRDRYSWRRSAEILYRAIVEDKSTTFDSEK